MKPRMTLDQNLFSLPTQTLAEQLVGKILVRQVGGNLISGRIVETEAYLPTNDPANHAYRGKTKRCQSLFLEAGHFYVYQVHRYYCLNLVAEPIDHPGCVLLRAIEPIDGIEILSTNRKVESWKQLTNGPGKICQAFAINKQLDGQRANNNTFNVKLIDSEYQPKIVRTPRVGITKNVEALLRFIDTNSSCLSKRRNSVVPLFCVDDLGSHNGHQ